jgi:fucose 4-O-acetylase-like acetyltransferase
VAHHAANWGFIVNSWGLELPVVEIGPEQIGPLTYYSLTLVQKITTFSVPAFLFVSGFFVAYAARGTQSVLSWKMVRARITKLLIPYLIWSVIAFVYWGLEGNIYSPARYVLRLVYGGAFPEYYYVPLLIQLYVLALVIVPLAKSHPGKVLLGAAAVQLVMIAFNYARVWVVDPNWQWLFSITGRWALFTKWIFYFCLGIVISLDLKKVQILTRYKWLFLGIAVVFLFVGLLENEAIFRFTGEENWRSNPFTLSITIYVIAFILCFLGFKDSAFPLSKTFHELNAHSFGIYLLHPLVIMLVMPLLSELVPLLYRYQFIFQPLLVVIAIGIPFLLMRFFKIKSLAKYYSYLFG